MRKIIAVIALLFSAFPALAQTSQTFPSYVGSLPTASALNPSDSFYLLQGGISKRLLGSTLISAAGLGLTLGSTPVPLGGTVGVSGTPINNLYLSNPVITGAASTSPTTGALIVAGGAGIAGNLNVGGNLNASGNALLTPTVTLNSSGSASANSTAINAAIQTLGAAGGGTVQLPCGGNLYFGATIDNNVSGVLVRACPNGVYSTVLLPTFSGVALKHRTPYGTGSTPENLGGGFVGFTINGNSEATQNLVIDSVSQGTYDLTSIEAAGSVSNIEILSCITGTNLAQCDVQLQRGYMNFLVYQLTTTAKAIQVLGSTNADFSGSPNVTWNIVYNNGLAVDMGWADSNIIWLGTFRAAGGTGNCLLMRGLNSSTSQGAYGNIFRWLGCGYGDGSAPTVYAQGTGDAGVTGAVSNAIQMLDINNGTAIPTAGTGSSWNYQTSSGILAYDTGSVGNGDVLSFGTPGAAPAGVASPNAISLGNDYSGAAGTGLKLKLLDSTVIYGLGVSAGQLDIVSANTTAFWYLSSKVASINSSGIFTSSGLVATAAAPTVSSNQIGYGSTVAAASNCGGGSVTGCIVVNVAGTARYVPYY
jgi:hypothetical protein